MRGAMAVRQSHNQYLSFEQPVRVYDERIAKLEELSRQNNVDLSADIAPQKTAREKLLKEIFGHLSAWDRIQTARHIHRPQLADYIRLFCGEFIELHGDRAFADDHAIMTGLA